MIYLVVPQMYQLLLFIMIILIISLFTVSLLCGYSRNIRGVFKNFLERESEREREREGKNWRERGESKSQRQVRLG